MNGKILLGDCMAVMATYPDKHFDLAIVDPPYGMGADKKNSKKVLQTSKSAALSKNYGQQEWDSDVPTEDYFIELFRVSKNQIIWGVNYYPYPFISGGRIYWDKCVTMPTYSDGELAYCSLLNSIKYYKYAWYGMIQGDMKNKESRVHPTQKPIALYKWLLQNYAKSGDKILDTHGGSMSSIIAFEDMGFKDYICTEIDPDYYAAGVKRVEQFLSQPKLF